MCLIFLFVCFVVCISTSTICTQGSMNIHVWIIIKVCKALDQSFWVILVVLLQLSTAIPRRPLARSRKTRRRVRSLLPAVPMYKHILESSSKCFFSLTGFPHPLGFPSFSPPMRVGCLHLSYRKQKKNRLPLNVTPHLPPTFNLILWSLSAASTGWGWGGSGGTCDWLWARRERGAWQAGPAVFTGAWR